MTITSSHQLTAELDPDNAGVLIVHMGGRGEATRGGIGSDEITRRLERDDDRCVIM